MLKPVFAAMVAQIVATVVLAVCLSVAAVAAAFALYQLLSRLMPDYLASGLLSLIFLALSAGVMIWLQRTQQAKLQDAPPKFGLRLLGDLAMAGAVTFISAAGVRPRR
jgi:uncharacterized PurR-regulated membrane protein YhhQ (DUF165 family)